MSKEKPILFTTPMVEAILNGTKNQTRRIVKGDVVITATLSESNKKTKFCKGDILWVRETWQHTDSLNMDPTDENSGYIYKASENGRDWESNTEGWTWKPSMFMPKTACRIKLLVTNVRIERLNKINETDAIGEGIEQEFDTYLDYSSKTKTGHYVFLSPINSYRSLWEKINGIGSWNVNPYVYVVNFKIKELYGR